MECPAATVTVVVERVARQHRIEVCRMTLVVRKAVQRTRLWKMKKEYSVEVLGCWEVLPDDWITVACSLSLAIFVVLLLFLSIATVPVSSNV